MKVIFGFMCLSFGLSPVELRAAEIVTKSIVERLQTVVEMSSGNESLLEDVYRNFEEIRVTQRKDFNPFFPVRFRVESEELTPVCRGSQHQSRATMEYRDAVAKLYAVSYTVCTIGRSFENPIIYMIEGSEKAIPENVRKISERKSVDQVSKNECAVNGSVIQKLCLRTGKLYGWELRESWASPGTVFKGFSFSSREPNCLTLKYLVKNQATIFGELDCKEKAGFRADLVLHGVF